MTWLSIQKNPKVSTIKLLKLINDFNKVAGYKINNQILVMFLNNSNIQSENEINEAILLPIVSKKKIKYLEINITNDWRLVHWKLQKTAERNKGRPK